MIEKVLNDAGLREHLSALEKNRYALYSYERMADEMADLFAQTMDGCAR